MGNKIDKTFWQGVSVQDDRVTFDNLRAKDSLTNPSVYGQKNPRPGVPVASQQTHLTVESSGTQSEDGHLEFQTTRAGHTEPEGAGFVWRDVADDKEQWMGWDPYQVVTGWEPIRCSNSILDQRELTIIRLQSGCLLIAGVNNTLVSMPKLLYRYDPVDRSFTTINLFLDGPVGSGSTARGPGLVQLPTGRILFFIQTQEGNQIDAYYSDDDGTTWNIYSTRVLKTALLDAYGEIPDLEQITVAYQGGQLVMVIEAEDSEDTTTNNGSERLHQFYQYASDDLGQNFVFISGLLDYDDEDTIRACRFPKVLPIPSGGFILGFLERYNVIGVPETSDFSQYVCRSIGSAWQAFSDITDTVIYTFDGQTGSQTWLEIGFTMWFDEDGVLYALCADDLKSTSATVPAQGRERISYLVCRSMDMGRSWSEWTSWSIQTDNSDRYLRAYDCDCTAGRALLVTRWTEGEQPDNEYGGPSVAGIFLGGFSTHTVPTVDGNIYFRDIDYLGYSDSNDGNWNSGRVWLPIGLPQWHGWTYTGIAGTLTLGCDLNIASNIGQNPFFLEAADTTQNDAVFCEFEMRLDDGGSMTSDQVLVALQLGDSSSYEYRVHIRIGPTGIRIRDFSGAANIGDITLDTSVRFKFRAILDKSGSQKFRCWYARAEDHHREWTEGPSGNVGNALAGWGPDQVEWGHWGGTTAHDSNWFYLGYSFFPSYWAEQSDDDPANDWENPRDIHPHGYPTIGPHLIHDGVQIRASSGPSRIGEIQTIEADYDYPIWHIDPRLSPSPSHPWRSAEDNHVQEITWNLRGGAGTIWQDNFPLLAWVRDSNIREFYLDGWNGAAWVNLGHARAYDGFGALSIERREERVRPDLSSACHGDNYLFHEAHAGDTMLLPVGGENPRPVKIVGNSEGAWESDGSGIHVATKTPTIILDRDNIAGLATTGTGAEIWRRDFGILIPNALDGQYEYIRLRIPAHETADGYYQIGVAYVGPAFVFGRSYDNEWTISEEENIDITTRQDGIRSSRILGPRRRFVTFAFANTAISMCPVQAESPSPDYVDAMNNATTPMATPHDTTRMMMGVVQRSGGSNLPVCLLRYVPQGDPRYEIQLNIDRGQHYGRIVTDPSVDNVIGTELHTETERMSRITIEEEV